MILMYTDHAGNLFTFTENSISVTKAKVEAELKKTCASLGLSKDELQSNVPQMKQEAIKRLRSCSLSQGALEILCYVYIMY